MHTHTGRSGKVCRVVQSSQEAHTHTHQVKIDTRGTPSSGFFLVPLRCISTLARTQERRADLLIQPAVNQTAKSRVRGFSVVENYAFSQHKKRTIPGSPRAPGMHVAVRLSATLRAVTIIWQYYYSSTAALGHPRNRQEEKGRATSELRTSRCVCAHVVPFPPPPTTSSRSSWKQKKRYDRLGNPTEARYYEVRKVTQADLNGRSNMPSTRVGMTACLAPVRASRPTSRRAESLFLPKIGLMLHIFAAENHPGRDNIFV